MLDPFPNLKQLFNQHLQHLFPTLVVSLQCAIANQVSRPIGQDRYIQITMTPRPGWHVGEEVEEEAEAAAGAALQEEVVGADNIRLLQSLGVRQNAKLLPFLLFTSSSIAAADIREMVQHELDESVNAGALLATDANEVKDRCSDHESR